MYWLHLKIKVFAYEQLDNPVFMVIKIVFFCIFLTNAINIVTFSSIVCDF